MQTRTKTVIAIGAAAVVLGTGGVAVAQGAGAGTAGHGHRAPAGPGVRRGAVEHGQFVTKNRRTGAQVTHDIANGTVSAVSATSVAVRTGDGTTVTFGVTASTKVHVKGQAKGATSTIAAVRAGQDVFVAGTGTGPFTATSVRVR